MPPTQTRFGGVLLPISAHFIFGESTRKHETMVKLQLVANAMAKSRSQIKPKPVKGSSINTILIFLMADVSGCSSHIAGRSQSIIKIQDLTNKSRKGASLLHTRGTWRLWYCFPTRSDSVIKVKVEKVETIKDALTYFRAIYKDSLIIRILG